MDTGFPGIHCQYQRWVLLLAMPLEYRWMAIGSMIRTWDLTYCLNNIMQKSASAAKVAENKYLPDDTGRVVLIPRAKTIVPKSKIRQAVLKVIKKNG